jgi:hypothetical protein
MIREEYEKLVGASEENAYISIAVNADGTPVRNGFVPWVRTASAFNMKTPDLTISVRDLKDEKVTGLLKICRVTGCYIYEGLDDYSFIGEFGDIRDLHILHGENLKDLTFLRQLKELFMFYLEDASLPDIRPLVDACNGSGGPGRCFGFRNCRIGDTSALEDIRFTLSELLVWPDGEDDEVRWKKGVKPGVFRFYK